MGKGVRSDREQAVDIEGSGARRGRLGLALALAWLLGIATACSSEAPEPAPPPAEEPPPAPTGPDAAALQSRASGIFGTLPGEVPNSENPITDAKVELGRALYYDARLSKNHDISCNSCHQLDRFGVDGEPTSPGHKGQRGDRNSPTVYNAALHLAQFWDGRAADVEAQAKGPVLNPIEMAMPSEEVVVAVLGSIPDYGPMFDAAFPDDETALTYDNMANAIGAFERRLMTPSRFDDFLAGNTDALSEEELVGLETFLDTGCTTCHSGVGIGGNLYQKLGLVRAYETEDPGRAAVTGNDSEKHFFKVPSLRNIAETGPYFHDGSVATLDEAIRIMAAIQLGKELDDAQVRSIREFLKTLTGKPDATLIAMPTLPESGPDTPAPDPS
ncbi:MAG: cytochrome-c peroxidase [Myxococcota bacterium]